MKILDIGHKNYSLDKALTELETSVSSAMHEESARVIKVIHGHGKGTMRTTVREWCDDQSGRFRAVIFGEDYEMFHTDSMEMRSECGIFSQSDFGKKNRGVTYIWLY